MENFINILYGIRAWPALLAYAFAQNKETIQRDIVRNCGSFRKCKSSIQGLLLLLRVKKVFRNIFYYRIKKQQKILYIICRILLPQQEDCEITGEIGPGLVIWHGYGTVISCRSAGSDFTVYQGVTIGRNQKAGQIEDKPIFGNNCNVFSNAVVAGGITIGDGTNIGAGAVCMKNVPDNTLVIGNPCVFKCIEVKNCDL